MRSRISRSLWQGLPFRCYRSDHNQSDFAFITVPLRMFFYTLIKKLKLFSLLEIKEGLKQAIKIDLPVLMASFFRNSLIYCHFSLRCKMTFSAIQKLKLFSLLKIKEGLKKLNSTRN